jgi:hypothetical protein
MGVVPMLFGSTLCLAAAQVSESGLTQQEAGTRNGEVDADAVREER